MNNKQQLLKTLQNGICELTYTDGFSVQRDAIITLSPTHLPTSPTQEDTVDITEKPHTIVAFDVNAVQWRSFSVHNIVDLEQLTGVGAEANENKLLAGSDYLNQLDLFSDFGKENDDEQDSMEHPEL